jgi:hypothetical protein
MCPHLQRIRSRERRTGCTNRLTLVYTGNERRTVIVYSTSGAVVHISDLPKRSTDTLFRARIGLHARHHRTQKPIISSEEGSQPGLHNCEAGVPLSEMGVSKAELPIPMIRRTPNGRKTVRFHGLWARAAPDESETRQTIVRPQLAKATCVSPRKTRSFVS